MPSFRTILVNEAPCSNQFNDCCNLFNKNLPGRIFRRYKRDYVKSIEL